MTAIDSHYINLLRERSTPIAPRPTGLRPLLRRLPDVRAVLFDAYGTLFVSASGELGTVDEQFSAQAFSDALTAVGARLEIGALEGAREFHATVEQTHLRLGVARGEFPEVDILRVWRETLERLAAARLVTTPPQGIDLATLALEYETRSNPVWPMPGAQKCLSELSSLGVVVGVVSNAQWFTPMLFPALMGGCLETLGVPRDLQLWSYEIGEAKPGLTLFRRARAALAHRMIVPSQVLFVGNDLLCDVEAAQQVGFRAALFAGDERSLRLRDGDQRVSGTHPDLVVLNLLDVVRCVRPGD